MTKRAQPPCRAGCLALCELRVGATIEADLDLGGGAYGWVPGVVTKVRPERVTFRATFRRAEDLVSSVLRFHVASEGCEWRWPTAPDAAAAAVAVEVAAASAAMTASSVSPCAFAGIDCVRHACPFHHSFRLRTLPFAMLWTDTAPRCAASLCDA